jgi:hypothetical protein
MLLRILSRRSLTPKMFEAILNLERREHQPKINYPHAASVQQIMIIVKISQPPVHCVYLTREIAGAWELFGCDSPDGAATIYHDYFAPIGERRRQTTERQFNKTAAGEARRDHAAQRQSRDRSHRTITIARLNIHRLSALPAARTMGDGPRRRPGCVTKLKTRERNAGDKSRGFDPSSLTSD